MGASNLKSVLISSTSDCNTFHNFLSIFKKKEIFKSWQVCDWLTMWLIMLGYMDLTRRRVCQCSNVLENQDTLTGSTVVFLCGTNDLKRGTARQQVNAQHKEITQMITSAGATLVAVQIPPVYPPQARAEIRNRDIDIINEILAERHGDAVASTEIISLHRGQIKKDGIHLTNESAEAIAENISTAIQAQRDNETGRESIRITVDSENIELQDTDNNPTTEEFETTRQIAAKIIGKGGDRIRRIKSLYNVEIHTDETGENTRKFSISGTAEDTTKVLKVMKCIANETEDHDLEQQTRAQFTNAPRPPTVTKIPTRCWYYAKGECYRGSGCKFLHEQGPTDAPEDSESSASTTESEEREPTPVRKVTIKRKPLPQTTLDDDDTRHKQSTKTKTLMHPKPRRHRTPSASPERTERQGTKRSSRPRKRTPPGPRSSSEEENTYTRKQTRSRSRHQHNTDRSRTQSPPTKSTKKSQHSKSSSRHRMKTPPGQSSHHSSRRERTHSTARRESPSGERPRRQTSSPSPHESNRDRSRRTTPSRERSRRHHRTPSPQSPREYRSSRRHSPPSRSQSREDNQRRTQYRPYRSPPRQQI